MEGYMYPIVLNSQINNKFMDIDPLNTSMACGSVTLNPFSYTSYMEILEYNIST